MADYNEIPARVRTPGVYTEVSPARQSSGIGLFPYVSVIVAQRLATGAVAAGVPTRVLSTQQAEADFGVGSQAARMVAAFRATNPVGELWVCALDDDGAGVQAVGTITIGGAPTAGGSIPLYIGGERLLVPVSGTAANIAAAIVAEINDRPDLPVSAAVNPGIQEEVILTARQKGESGNAIDVRAAHLAGESIPAGITVAVVAMNGGSGNPDLTPALTALASTDVDVLVHPYTDAANLVTLETELADRATALRELPSWAVTAAVGTPGVLAAMGDARNSQFSTIFGLETFPGLPEERAAAIGGRVAYSGSIDPVRPFQTLGLPGYAPAVADRFTLTEREALLSDGIATTRATSSSEVQIERAITTYQETAQGVPDDTYLDVNTTLALKFARKSYRARIQTKFPRHKAAGDDVLAAPGSATMTPSVLKAESVTWYQELIDAALFEDMAAFKAESAFPRSVQDPTRFDVTLAINPVNQARVFAVSVQPVL